MVLPTAGAAGRAVVVCPAFPLPAMSGGVKRTMRLLEAMERAGADVHVVTLDQPAPEAVRDLGARGWHAHVVSTARAPWRLRIGQHARRRPAPYLPEVAAAVRKLVAGAPAFVQAEGPVAVPYVLGLAGIRRVSSFQNVDSMMVRAVAREDRSGGWRRLRGGYHAHRLERIERRAARTADAVICVSEEDAAVFRDLGGAVVMAPNGVDEELFAVPTAAPDNEDVLFFGQFTYEPNLHGVQRFLSEGWPRLAALRPRARLLLAGQGGLEHLGDGLDPAGRIRVLGPVPDLRALLQSCRVTLVPIWRGGGTRLKVLEALAAARPVIGTPLGVSGLGFRDGQHGLVAAAPVGLAEATASLLADPWRAGELSEEGRRLAARFTWSAALMPVEELYRAWLAGAVGGGPPR